MEQKISRVGFKSAAFIFNSMENSMTEEKGAYFEEGSQGILIMDNHPERARKRSLFPTVLVPWGNVAYVCFAKEAPVVAAPAKRGRKAVVETDEEV